MNSRPRYLGFLGSKRQSNRNGSQSSQQSSTSTLQAPVNVNGSAHIPAASTSSTTSLPMNPQQQNGHGRPPSYSNYANNPGRQSPLPPINTGNYPAGHPALNGQPGPPPGYGGGYGGVANGVHGGAPQPTLGSYGAPRQTGYGAPGGAPVEVEGAGRSKAQLIVGIDFVSYCDLSALHEC